MYDNQAMLRSHDLPTRRVLALSTTGGFTHAAPVLDVCRVLADRGHTVEFATHDGQEVWVKNPNYTFINKVHLVGPGPTPEQYADHWERMVRLPVEEALSSSLMWKSKYLWDSFWPATYRQLKRLCRDPETRPDFIVADFFDETVARDMNLECGVPIAVVWPQMPYLLAPASYIPGQPGFQIDLCLTSERASLWSRLRNEMAVVWAAPQFLKWTRWFTALRRREGARFPVLPGGNRPHHLVLVNSFFGLEAPKDLPPLVAPVGPVLSEEYPALDERHARFLESHDRVVYVGLGTNVVLPEPSLRKLLRGLVLALDEGHIDGVIWAVNQKTRKTLDLEHPVPRRAGGKVFTLRQVLDGAMPDFLTPDFAPQRAILDHSHTRLYLTHGGGSSANEAAYHGVPVLVLGFMFDQLANGLRLEEAGCGLRLDKNGFAADEVAKSVSSLVKGDNEVLMRNVERMRCIATVASRRKGLAADLIEEVMFDHELRGPERPMHLQTADMRMSWWKVRNLDLGLFTITAFVGLPVVTLLGIRSLLQGRVLLTPLRQAILAPLDAVKGFSGQFLGSRH